MADTKALAAPSNDTVICPKCMGSGKYITYSPYTGQVSYSGRCFNCDGSGRVCARKVVHSKAARLRTANILYTVEHIINEAAARGQMERAEFYMIRMIPAMFTIGKPNARKILDALAGGHWRNDDAHSTSGVVEDPGTCVRLRARCIELGREYAAIGHEGYRAKYGLKR